MTNTEQGLPSPISAAAVKELLRTFALSPNKRLGQNFLIDPSVVETILTVSDARAGDRFLEIGPGLGVVTESLLERQAWVMAIEIDRGLAEVLRRRLARYEGFTLVEADALKVDWRSMAADAWGAQPNKVAANLPYYITGPLVARLLKEMSETSVWVLMVQEEVAERMVAAPGGKTYGSFSVLVQLYTEPKVIRRVSPSAFYPQPGVHSSLVELRRRPEVPDVDYCRDFEQLVRKLFQLRRKSLRQSLTQALRGATVHGATTEQADNILARAELEPNSRPEMLSIEQFRRLTDALRKINAFPL